jgi:uncharacterized protein YidB (DUF937 family)
MLRTEECNDPSLKHSPPADSCGSALIFRFVSARASRSGLSVLRKTARLAGSRGRNGVGNERNKPPFFSTRCATTTEATMGLLDVLTGMRNGPRGAGSGRGGMSPITMALLGLLADKAVKGFTAGSPRAGSGMATPGGGLGDLLKGGLGGAGLGGLGAILSGGLGDLVKQFQNAGKGDVADSWVGTGENKPIAPGDLSKVLTPEQIEFLTERTGMSREELLAGLSEQLPKAVDELTPQGRIPAPDDLNRTTELR